MRNKLKRVRRLVALGVTLAVTAVIVPDSGTGPRDAYLVKVQTSHQIEHSSDVVWILFIGSDARPGETPTQTRGDAIQLVGLNLKTGTAAALGIPRDSWVSIPGQGMNKINASLYFGGPELMAKSVANLVGISPDYVFVTSFTGFKNIVRGLGHITVQSAHTWSDPYLNASFKTGKNVLNPINSLRFARSRHGLPAGDFDRSANQQRLLVAILSEVLAHEDTLGFMERLVSVGMNNLYTDLGPSELYHLAQAATLVKPKKVQVCVVQGSTGRVGGPTGPSVVFPYVNQAHAFAADAKDDAKLNRGCPS